MNGIFKKARKGLMKHKLKAVPGVLVIVGAGYYFGVYLPAQSDDQSVSEIRTETAERGDLRVTVTGSGQVYAEEEVELSPVAAGDAIDVASVHVEDDQSVRAGDLIATLDMTDADRAVRDAELFLWDAEVKMRQTEKLYDSLTEDDRMIRQNQEASLRREQNKLADALEDAEDYRIRAPFDGIVTGLAIEAGDSVSRSDVVASVISREMYVRVPINEIDIAGVEAGNAAELSFEALGDRAVTGAVSHIDTLGTVSQNVVSYGVEIAFDSLSFPDIKPGMSVDVEIATQEKNDIMTVPITAVKFGSAGKAYVLEPPRDGSGSFRKIPVETGISNDTVVEIVSGIVEGQEILLDADADVASSDRAKDRSEGGESSFMDMPRGGGMKGGRPPGK